MENIVIELRKFVAPKLVFGTDARLLAGRYAANLGVKRALLVTDTNVIATGWGGDVEQSLTLAGKAIKDPCNATNPRIPTRLDLDTVYREAL
jgi:alcohol dehydrogenase class IV